VCNSTEVLVYVRRLAGLYLSVEAALTIGIRAAEDYGCGRRSYVWTGLLNGRSR
jgi:hypothetical protein